MLKWENYEGRICPMEEFAQCQTPVQKQLWQKEIMVSAMPRSYLCDAIWGADEERYDVPSPLGYSMIIKLTFALAGQLEKVSRRTCSYFISSFIVLEFTRSLVSWIFWFPGFLVKPRVLFQPPREETILEKNSSENI